MKRLKKLRLKFINRPKTIKNALLGLDLTEFTERVDPRELLALTFGFIITIVLILKGDLETGKTIALALIFYGIGRSVP